jgi:DNA-binding response OmpR family regulator
MATLLVLTNALQPAAEVLPALGLLLHQVKVAPAEASALLEVPTNDAILVDGRRELAQSRGLTRLIRTTGVDVPLFLIATEGGLAAVTADWGIDDVLLDTAGPAEVEARLRLAAGRLTSTPDSDALTAPIHRGELVIDETTYMAKVGGRTLDLTFKEFELLKYLAQHPGRVFTRAQLLQEVWGYDYYGGTRTVDVHVRRLRAKLGTEHDALVGTVRNVGYRFVPPREPSPAKKARETAPPGVGHPQPGPPPRVAPK